MSYLNFDKALLMNLERSLSKEMIRTNRTGAYNSTTLIDCNTRKYRDWETKRKEIGRAHG